MEFPKHWIAKKMPGRYDSMVIVLAGYHFGTFRIYHIFKAAVMACSCLPDQAPTLSLFHFV